MGFALADTSKKPDPHRESGLLLALKSSYPRAGKICALCALCVLGTYPIPKKSPGGGGKRGALCALGCAGYLQRFRKPGEGKFAPQAPSLIGGTQQQQLVSLSGNHKMTLSRFLVACRREFVTADAAGSVGILPPNRSGVCRVGVDISAELSGQVGDGGKTPRAMTSRSILANQSSTWLSHEE